MPQKHEREYELFAHKYPKSPIAEAYRTLRTNLSFAAMDKSYRSILVTSVSPQDGKSTNAANLAVVLAQDGNKVILIDCDLRKPVLHKIFQLENKQGLTNCLLQKIEVEQLAHTGMVDNLTILTSGPIPPNPAEILGSDRIKSLLPALKEKFDYVIIDAPPIMAVTDASIISAQVDGVLMVVNYGVTRNDLAREAQEQIKKANANLIGVILNKVKMDDHGYQYYYYYSNESSSSSSIRL